MRAGANLLAAGGSVKNSAGGLRVPRANSQALLDEGIMNDAQELQVEHNGEEELCDLGEGVGTVTREQLVELFQVRGLNHHHHHRRRSDQQLFTPLAQSAYAAASRRLVFSSCTAELERAYPHLWPH
jgi:hypothetical protein